MCHRAEPPIPKPPLKQRRSTCCGGEVAHPEAKLFIDPPTLRDTFNCEPEP